jgi:hypothetical protein
MRQFVIMAVLLSCTMAAKDKTKLTVRAVSNQSKETPIYYTTPGTSDTHCTGSATTIGDTTSGAATCKTTSTPAQTDQVGTRTAVRQVVEANGLRYVIACEASWRWQKCDSLLDGDVFPAELDGTTMWITVHRGGNQGPKAKIKYKVLDIRPVESHQ